LIPSRMEATSDNVGDCLREWHLGPTKNRLRDTATGVMFNQNFRQNFQDYIGHSFAYQDNRVSLNDLNASKDIFNLKPE